MSTLNKNQLMLDNEVDSLEVSSEKDDSEEYWEDEKSRKPKGKKIKKMRSFFDK